MHDLKIKKESKDEEIDDVFLQGLGTSKKLIKSSKQPKQFKISELI